MTGPTRTRRVRRPQGGKASSLLLLLLLLSGCGKDGLGRQIADRVVPPQPPVRSATDPAADEPEKPMTGFDIGFASMGQRTPVIMYHDIIARRGRGSVWFDCTAEEFKKQMDEIADRGYVPVSVADLHDHLTSGKPLPPKAIVLTFDDNYQGFYDRAYPVLKAHRFPAIEFVHTGFVGDKKGAHPKMTWDELKTLVKDPLITIGSHTVTHPDLPTLDSARQTDEIVRSKADLEGRLGIKVDFFAYPEGKNDAVTQGYVKDAGYTLAFSIDNLPAEASPNILCVGRWVHTRLDRALDECDRALKGGADAVARVPLKAGPVEFVDAEGDGARLVMLRGGAPESVVSSTRESVGDFVKRTNAAGGINGTFFALAAIDATDNQLIGPSMVHGDALLPAGHPEIWPKLKNRPLLLWGPTAFSIVPYNPDRANDPTAYTDFMPDVTDAFLAGAWLVHDGKARDKDALDTFASKDIEDPRRRAAFGVDAEGRPVAACTRDSVSSDRFARMLAGAGLKEAVLLDSGFSTSLVLGNDVLASGHSTATEPSRPVPHAVVLTGVADPASQAAADKARLTTTDAPVAIPTDGPKPRRRRRKRR